MYVNVNAIGMVLDQDARRILDLVNQARSGGSHWSSYTRPTHPASREIRKELNAQLRRLGWKLPDDGTQFSMCAAVDALYASGTEINTKLKQEMGGCLTRYPSGKRYTDFLVDLRKLPYCVPPPGACFEARQEKDKAQTQAQYGYKPNRGTAPCRPNQREITPENIHQFDPDRIKNLPLCAPEPLPQKPLPQKPLPQKPLPQEPGGGGNILDYSDILWGQGPDARVAELIRLHINPALRAAGYRTLNEERAFNIVPCAALRVLFGDMVASNFSCPNFPNPQQFLKRANGLGSSVPYCEPRSIMCFDSQQEKDTAITQCQYGVLPKRGSDSCKRQMRFASNNLHQYDPCRIKEFPVCGETMKEAQERLKAEQYADAARPIYQQQTSEDPVPSIYSEQDVEVFQESQDVEVFQESEEEEPEDNPDKTWMLYGVIGVLAVGGAYWMTRNKKKRR